MQALMLAAGMGRRMGKYTRNHTKCMIPVGGKTLLERVVNALKLAGIQKLIMVIGYEAQVLQSYITSAGFDLEIEYIFNTEYKSTNNIYSLFLAREKLTQDDTILLESDLIFDPAILSKIIHEPAKNIVVAAKYEQWMDGTVLTLDDNNNIIDFVDKTQFRYADVNQYYKTVNIYKFSKEFSTNQYIPFLEAYLKAYGTNQYYEQVLKILSHIRSSELKAYILNEEKWYEIDDSQDLDIANTMFAKDADLLKKYELHFGGYWRFPKVKDFCYLVNPYYPPAQMVDQMKFFYQELLTQYPSGMKIQKLNAARMLEVDEDYLLIGNGAAELIAVLGRQITGRLSVCIPTFNEYIRCFPNCEIHCIHSSHYRYQYNKSALLEEITHTDYLLLINPDNPSGSFLTFKDLSDILAKCETEKVTCILDESFLDFTDSDLRYSLLNNRLLRKYPHLIVIKSISKSYGIPGLRLGVLASSDKQLLKKIQYQMPIWNINSFAEYYLQIQRLYRKSYIDACNRIAEQRHLLYENLVKLTGIIPYPSQANYIMCELEEGINSKDLATLLLKKHNILIKDLSVKSGFHNKPFIRIAVKSKEDNDLLIFGMKKCLEQLREDKLI